MADRDLAKLKWDSTEVRAPIAGTISGSLLDAGSVVTADTTTLTTIVAFDPMYVVFNLDESIVLLLKGAGKKQADHASIALVTVGVAGDDVPARPAKVNLADLRVLAREQVQCRAALANRDGLLFPGLSATVRVVISQPHQAVLIPAKAVVYPNGPRVGVVNEKNKVDVRPVEVGLVHAGLIVVTAGLRADEWVIAEMWPLQTQ